MRVMFQEFPEDNMNDNYLNERRQKIADDNMMNFEEHNSDMKRSRSVFIGAVSGLALAGIVGYFALSPHYSADNIAEIPTIRRPQSAVKVKPSNPGGMEILNQDKTVYDIIEKEPASKQVESILPPPEQPILPEIKAEVSQPAQFENNNQLAPVEETTEVKVSEVKTIETPKAVVNEVKEVNLPSIKEVSMAAAAKEKPIEPKAEPKIEPKPEVKTPAPTTVTKQTASKAAASGDWQIQLMSSPNKKAVDSAWASMVKKHPALANQPHEIETADLGAKGTYYRLKAGAFNDRSDADNLCNTIKKQGGSCIVKKK